MPARFSILCYAIPERSRVLLACKHTSPQAYVFVVRVTAVQHPEESARSLSTQLLHPPVVLAGSLRARAPARMIGRSTVVGDHSPKLLIGDDIRRVGIHDVKESREPCLYPPRLSKPSSPSAHSSSASGTLPAQPACMRESHRRILIHMESVIATLDHRDNVSSERDAFKQRDLQELALAW